VASLVEKLGVMRVSSTSCQYSLSERRLPMDAIALLAIAAAGLNAWLWLRPGFSRAAIVWKLSGSVLLLVYAVFRMAAV